MVKGSVARGTLSVALVALLTGCGSMAPEFKKPEAAAPKAFKEAAQDPAAKPSSWWQEVKPLEAADWGRWWVLFSDTRLNELEDEAASGNQPLQAYAARVEQARAVVRANHAALLPTFDAGLNAARTRPSASTIGFGSSPYTVYSARAVASYEPDLFGRISDREKAAAFDANAAEAAYRSVLLTLQADVAQNYFLIRALDEERRLIRKTVRILEKQSGILQKRYALGDVGEQDYAHARSDLASASAELISLDRRRADLEHALAVLLGKAPSDFTLPEDGLKGAPPAVPGGVPSTVLGRRPDISAAIADMEAANQRIGIAKAASFPSLLLTATAGSESASLGSLFQWSARTWTLGQLGGLALTLPIFDTGRRSAELDRLRAAYEESVADYRQQVLVAFRDVEDGLSDQHHLYRQWLEIKEASDQAVRATHLVQKRYDLGDVDYFEVVETQRQSLGAERAAVQVRGQRFVAAVSLIRALGGSWDSKN